MSRPGPSLLGNGPPDRRRSGITLVEVMVSLALLGMLVGAVGRTLFAVRHITEASSQRVAAFGLCEARLEEARGMAYDDVVAANFLAETNLPLSHLSGQNQLPITCGRTVAIQTLAAPVRKQVEVTVAWTYQGRNLQEHFTGVLYPE